MFWGGSYSEPREVFGDVYGTFYFRLFRGGGVGFPSIGLPIYCLYPTIDEDSSISGTGKHVGDTYADRNRYSEPMNFGGAVGCFSTSTSPRFEVGM